MRLQMRGRPKPPPFRELRRRAAAVRHQYRSEQERKIFFEMAETWLVAAMRQEAGPPISSNVETGDTGQARQIIE